MIFVNISDIERNLLNFAIAKNDLEEFWLQQNIITDRLTIADFISAIDFGKQLVYIDRTQEYCPFKLLVTDKSEYMFYCGDLNDNDKKYLLNHRYLDNVNEIDTESLILKRLNQPDGDYFFVIDNKFYQ